MTTVKVVEFKPHRILGYHTFFKLQKDDSNRNLIDQLIDHKSRRGYHVRTVQLIISLLLLSCLLTFIGNSYLRSRIGFVYLKGCFPLSYDSYPYSSMKPAVIATCLIGIAGASPPVQVQLRTSWPSPPFTLEIL